MSCFDIGSCKQDCQERRGAYDWKSPISASQSLYRPIHKHKRPKDTWFAILCSCSYSSKRKWPILGNKGRRSSTRCVCSYAYSSILFCPLHDPIHVFNAHEEQHFCPLCCLHLSIAACWRVQLLLLGHAPQDHP